MCRSETGTLINCNLHSNSILRTKFSMLRKKFLAIVEFIHYFFSFIHANKYNWGSPRVIFMLTEKQKFSIKFCAMHTKFDSFFRPTKQQKRNNNTKKNGLKFFKHIIIRAKTCTEKKSRVVYKIGTAQMYVSFSVSSWTIYHSICSVCSVVCIVQIWCSQQ